MQNIPVDEHDSANSPLSDQSIPLAAISPAALAPIAILKPRTAARRFLSASAPMATLFVVNNEALVV